MGFPSFKFSLFIGASALLLASCSAGPTPQKGEALPPPDTIVKAQPKGLNLMGPTLPATKVAVKDDDDMGPNPAPTVEMAPANAKPDVESRIANLEAQLAALRADYDQIVPTFKTLSVNTDRLVGLLDELEGHQASSVAPAAGPVMASETVQGQAAIQKIRFGAHPDKTRIVLDLTKLTNYDYDLDNVEGVLTISLPEASGTGSFSDRVASPFIESWSQQPGPNGGTVVVLQLKRVIDVKAHNALPASGKDGPRIYLDIVDA